MGGKKYIHLVIDWACFFFVFFRDCQFFFFFEVFDATHAGCSCVTNVFVGLFAADDATYALMAPRTRTVQA